jgi:hypothetical protein
MELLTGAGAQKVWMEANSDRKIGKFSMNHMKFHGGKLNLHAGHLKCIRLLKEQENCDLVVVEFVHTDHMKMETSNLYDTTEAEAFELCKDLEGVDAVVYCDPTEVTPAHKSRATKRFNAEGYAEKYVIPYPEAMKGILDFIEARDMHNYTMVRCWKTGVDSLIYQHYLKTYKNVDIILVEPEYYGNSKVPMYGSKGLSNLPEGYAAFALAFDADPESHQDADHYCKVDNMYACTFKGTPVTKVV